MCIVKKTKCPSCGVEFSEGTRKYIEEALTEIFIKKKKKEKLELKKKIWRKQINETVKQILFLRMQTNPKQTNNI